MTLTFLTGFAALVFCFRQRLCLTNWTEAERYQEQDGEDSHGRIQSMVANRRFAMVLCQGRLETVMDEMRQRGRIEGKTLWRRHRLLPATPQDNTKAR